MTVSICVPFSPESDAPQRPAPHLGASRETIWSWLKLRWEELCPAFELVTSGSGAGPMNRAAARNRAVERACGDVLIISDADTVFHRAQIDIALQHIANGKQWVIPYKHYEQLTGPDTLKVLKQLPSSDVARPAKPRWSTDQGNAGLMVLTREAFDEVRGYDERFTGWSGEDWSFCNALHTLVHHQVRVDTYVLHLRHPPSRGRRQDKARQMSTIYPPYDRAFGDPVAMRAVIDNPERNR